MRFQFRFLFCCPVLKNKPLKATITLILLAVISLTACQKEQLTIPVITPEPCKMQTANPAGRSYSADSIIDYTCTSTHCGVLPLNSRNYWVYEDSIFQDGVFMQVRFDTLRFTRTQKSLTDDLVWWESNMTIGLPEKLYANDSAVYKMEDRMFTQGVKDVKKEFGMFAGDSTRYLSGFQDAAAITRSLKNTNTFNSRAGAFSETIYIEKNARNYRRDQVIFKPGIGVLRYVQEKAPMGTRIIKLQQISNLVSFHIE